MSETSEQREPERISIRSYRLVTDRIERRLFKIDKYRLPVPYGIPLRSVGYTVATLLVMLVGGRLPLVGPLMGLLPIGVKWLAIPGLAGFALTHIEVDGRPPHKVALSGALHLLQPRSLSGLRPTPRRGERLAPVLEIATRPSGAEPEYTAGRIKGPSRVVFGYPCKVELERIPLRSRRSVSASKERRLAKQLARQGLEREAAQKEAHRELSQERLRVARRLRVQPIDGAHPLVVGQQIEIPEGRELVFAQNGSGARR